MTGRPTAWGSARGTLAGLARGGMRGVVWIVRDDDMVLAGANDEWVFLGTDDDAHTMAYTRFEDASRQAIIYGGEPFAMTLETEES